MPRRMGDQKPQKLLAHPGDRCRNRGLRATDAARHPFIDSLLWIIILTPKLIKDWIEAIWISITFR
jgi:hypothetical protein